MIDNLIYIMQASTLEQLKTKIDKNIFTDKELKEFNKGKEIIDNLIELNKTNIGDNVKNVLMLYCMYKLKGGK